MSWEVITVFTNNFCSPSPKSDLDLGEGREGGQLHTYCNTRDLTAQTTDDSR